MNDRVLANIDKARLLLAEAKTIQEAKHIADVAEAARIYAKRVEASIITVNHAAEIKIRAERLLGEMLAKSPKNPGTRVAGGSREAPPQTQRLRDAGVSKKQSARSQKLARIPEPKFEAVIADTKKTGKEITTANVLRITRMLEPEKYPQKQKGDDDETCWRRGLLYRAQAAAADAAFEDWSNFRITPQIINAAETAAKAWGKTADYLRKLSHEQKEKTHAA